MFRLEGTDHIALTVRDVERSVRLASFPPLNRRQHLPPPGG